MCFLPYLLSYTLFSLSYHLYTMNFSTRGQASIWALLGPRNFLDWQNQMYSGNIKPVFRVLGPSLPGLIEGSLYICVKDVNLIYFRVLILG